MKTRTFWMKTTLFVSLLSALASCAGKQPDHVSAPDSEPDIVSSPDSESAIVSSPDSEPDIVSSPDSDSTDDVLTWTATLRFSFPEGFEFFGNRMEEGVVITVSDGEPLTKYVSVIDEVVGSDPVRMPWWGSDSIKCEISSTVIGFSHKRSTLVTVVDDKPIHENKEYIFEFREGPYRVVWAMFENASYFDDGHMAYLNQMASGDGFSFGEGDTVFCEHLAYPGETVTFDGLRLPEDLAGDGSGRRFLGWKLYDQESSSFIPRDSICSVEVGHSDLVFIPKYGGAEVIFYGGQDENGNRVLLQRSYYRAGETPIYLGETPTTCEKSYRSDTEVEFKFIGWDKEIKPITPEQEEKENTIYYYARFETINTAYQVTWRDHDDSILEQKMVPVGEIPVYTGPTPSKKSDDLNDFVFIGWDKEYEPVSWPRTYKALYETRRHSYVVNWRNYDGTLLSTSIVKKGQAPVYEGEDPTRPSDETGFYTFSGWIGKNGEDFGPANSDIDYVAQFERKTFFKAACEQIRQKWSDVHKTYVDRSSTPFDEQLSLSFEDSDVEKPEFHIMFEGHRTLSTYVEYTTNYTLSISLKDQASTGKFHVHGTHIVVLTDTRYDEFTRISTSANIDLENTYRLLDGLAMTYNNPNIFSIYKTSADAPTNVPYTLNETTENQAYSNSIGIFLSEIKRRLQDTCDVTMDRLGFKNL